MPILRISAQEIHGIVVDDNERRAMERLSRGGEVMATLVRAAMRDYQIAPEVCLPGIVNITPRYWKRNRAEHILEVLPGGEAAFCHVVPKDHNLAPVPYSVSIER